VYIFIQASTEGESHIVLICLKEEEEEEEEEEESEEDAIERMKAEISEIYENDSSLLSSVLVSF
jgi:hypothetical protein